MKNKLSVIDLFSGCGGSALGFRNAGFNIKAAVEIDLSAAESFRKNFPEALVINKDISGIKGKDILNDSGIESGNEVILLACPPCQGFSNARRVSERLQDPRNKLIWEFIRLVREIKPLFFIMENVPGLATGIGKTIFDETLNELKRIDYKNFSYRILQAADFGVPQKRRRLVFIGTKIGDAKISLPNPTNQDPVLPNKYLPAWITIRETISDLPSIKAGEKSPDDNMHVAAHVSDLNLERLRHTPKNGGSRTSWPERYILNCHKGFSGHKDVYGRMKWDAPSPAITGGCGMISKGRFGHPEQNRAMSLREAARLQTFPDSFEFSGNFGQITKQIGNAVPPLLARRIANAIKRSLKLYFSEKNFSPDSVSSIQGHSQEYFQQL